MNGIAFSLGNGRDGALQQSHQYRPVRAHRRGQIEAEGGLAGDANLKALFVRNGVTDGEQIANERIGAPLGQPAHSGAHIRCQHQLDLGVLGAQPLLRGIAFHHQHLLSGQLTHATDQRRFHAREDGHRKLQVRRGEMPGALAAFRGGHDRWQQIELTAREGLQRIRPVSDGLRLKAHPQQGSDFAHVIGGDAGRLALVVVVFNRRPVVQAIANDGMLGQPGAFALAERQALAEVVYKRLLNPASEDRPPL